MLLADLTWEQVSAYLKEKDSLLIPVGICEQHSKHLPLNTDILISEYICNYLSEKTKILTAPTINYGVGLPCDRFFPGTSSLQYEDLRGTVSSLINWWKLQGFKHFFTITAHGDPFHLRALRETGHDGVFVLDIWDIDLSRILDKQENAKHAGEAETSVMLHLFPTKVALERMEDFETPFKEFEDFLNHLVDDPIPNSPGCQGYPTLATEEKGEKIVEMLKRNALRWIQDSLKK